VPPPSLASLLGSPLPCPLPPAFAAVPLLPGQGNAPMRVCVLARIDGVGGVEPIRETMDARVLLGCLSDAAGRVHEWTEVWVQTVDPASLKALGSPDAVTNRVLDARWAARCTRLEAAPDAGLVRTGFESVHPSPTFLDLRRRQAVFAGGEESPTGSAWALCTDDALLREAGLPAFGESADRYLCRTGGGEGPRFVPVTAGAPTNASTRSAEDAFTLGDGLVDLNAGGGLLMVVRHHPFTLERYIDALGAAAAGERSASASVRGDADPFTPVLLSRGARAERLREVLWVKLMLLRAAAQGVRDEVSRSRAPMLNLSARSFRVATERAGNGAPRAWIARPVLVAPGSAVAIEVPGTSQTLFVSGEPSPQAIYTPSSAGRSQTGWGQLRVRKVANEDGGIVVEATLLTQERLATGARDHVRVRFPIGRTRVELFGAADARSGMAAGEVRFRTVPQRLEADVASALREAEGAPFDEVEFQLVSVAGTPSDLYALGVLATRMLLVDHERPLPEALDEVMSLAREAAAAHAPGISLAARIEAVLSKDPRWTHSLGPQRLAPMRLTAEAAMGVVPMSLWCRVLASIVRAFPGVGPDSICRDQSDSPEGAPEMVFDPFLSDVSRSADASRTLFMRDAKGDAELLDVVLGRLRGAG